MDLNRLRMIVAASVASLFVVLVLCVFAVQHPQPSEGIWVPMMRTRAVPLRNCSFNGFTIHVLADGKLTGADAGLKFTDELLVSRAAQAQDYISDDTFYVIADPSVPYGRVTDVLSEIQHAAPRDRVALVPREAQVEEVGYSSDPRIDNLWADRCVYEWVGNRRPERLVPESIPLPGGRLSVWKALWGKN